MKKFLALVSFVIGLFIIGGIHVATANNESVSPVTVGPMSVASFFDLEVFAVRSDLGNVEAQSEKPKRVRDVKVKNEKKTALTLTWKELSDVDHYLVRVMNKSKEKVKQVKATTNSKTVTGLTAGKTYKVKVRGVSGEIKGAWSKIVQAKTASDDEDDSDDSDESSDGDDDDDSSVQEFDLIARQFEFEPSTITVNEGDTVRFSIESEDVTHGFFLSEFDVDETLTAGETTEVEFVADKAGEYSFFCSQFCGSGHSGMTGTLVVE